MKTCKYCGRSFADNTSNSSRKFCSKSCRYAERYRRLYQPTQESREPRECNYCGASFSPGHGRQVYCCRDCKERAKTDRVGEWLREYKLARGCADCGFCAHSWALEFHHLSGRDKLYNTNELTSFEKAQEEIERCVVLCANCHRIRHAPCE